MRTPRDIAAQICRNWFGLDDPRHSHPETISSITRLIDAHIAEREAEMVERIVKRISGEFVDYEEMFGDTARRRSIAAIREAARRPA